MVTATGPRAADSTGVVAVQGVSFATYRALRADLARSGRRVRITFDRGTLEIMSPLLYEHEHISYLLGRFVNALAIGLAIPIVGAKSTTLAREDLERGAEPDECFYVANEGRVRFRKTIRLPDDPPPDLVIEVDVSRSSLDKRPLYAALGVAEFWRHESGVLEIHALGAEGGPRRVGTSLNFPTLADADVIDWLRRRESMDETSWIVAVIDWARDVLGPAQRAAGR